MLKIILSLSLSLVDYGDLINMHASASTLKPLDAVRHSALRFRSVDALSRTEHSTFG